MDICECRVAFATEKGAKFRQYNFTVEGRDNVTCPSTIRGVWKQVQKCNMSSGPLLLRAMGRRWNMSWGTENNLEAQRTEDKWTDLFRSYCMYKRDLDKYVFITAL